MHLSQMQALAADLESQLDGIEVVNRGINAHLGPIVKAYNVRYPGMNVRLAFGFGEMFKALAAHRDELARGPMHIIVRDGEGSHATAWRFQEQQGEVVGIGLCTLQPTDQSGITSRNQMVSKFTRQTTVSRIAYFHTGIQRSKYNCGALAMGFFDAFRKEPERYDGLVVQLFEPPLKRSFLARLLKSGDIAPGTPHAEGRIRVYDPAKSEDLLPTRIFKNHQSKRAFKSYLNRHPEAADAVVTSHERKETPIQRLQRIMQLENPLDDAGRAEMMRPTNKLSLRMVTMGVDYLEGKRRAHGN